MKCRKGVLGYEAVDKSSKFVIVIIITPQYKQYLS